MKQFQTIEKLDTGILYSLELASSVSVLLLAFGLIASMANVLTKGSVLSDSAVMRQIWAWTQCIAIDASVAGTIIRTFHYHREGEKVKTWLYGLLSVLLLFTAAIVSNIEATQQALNVTLEAAYLRVFVSVEALTWIRSISVVLIIVAHAMRHVSIGKPQDEKKNTPALQPQEQPQTAPPQLVITPDLIEALRQALTHHVTVIEEAAETRQIAAPITGTDAPFTGTDAPQGETNPLDRMLQQLDQMLPSVNLADITAVVTAYQSGTARREMCKHLKWGGARYTTIVKPVLDAYKQMNRQE